jgi:TonB family protein
VACRKLRAHTKPLSGRVQPDPLEVGSFSRSHNAVRPKSTISAVTPKILLGLSVLCLVSAAILGLLTGYDAQNKAAKAGAQVAQLQNEKTELQTKVAQLENEKTVQTKVEADQNEIASLQKRIEEGGTATKPSENPSAASAPEQQLTAPPPSLEIKPGAASSPEQPTSLPSLAEIKPEHVEETTPPPRQPKRQTIAIGAIKAPQVAGWPGGGTMSTVSARAVATYAPKPEYPSEMRTRHITGSGVCVVDIDPGSGNVTGASMAESTGNPILDDSAVRTFRKWRFKPGTVSRVRIPIEFR